MTGRGQQRIVLATAAVGGMLAYRRPQNAIELDTLRYELLAVIDETIAPSRASMWLRRSEGVL